MVIPLMITAASINRYKEQVHEEVSYAPPKQILQEIADLEEEIIAGPRKLEEMLG